MFLIAQNNFQFIVEFAVLLTIGIMLLLNIIPLSLSFVLLIALVLSIGLTLLFGFDAISLISPNLTTHEFTHPYGALALFSIVTCLAAIYIMDDVGINTRSLRNFVILLIILIALVGGTVHRDFLGMWILGLLVGFFILSKSFRRKSVLTIKRVGLVIITAVGAFGFFQALSTLINQPVLSPILRLDRLDLNSAASITMVLQNTFLIGHNPVSSYWGNATAGFADGYISLPINLITLFGLPYPTFYGILVAKKDVIDYFVPGIFGYSYDFGYIIMFLFVAYIIAVLIVGLVMLRSYREKRERGNKSLLGREALLIGAITAFISQAWVGLFIINRDINGTALVTFLFLGAMVLGHLLVVKRN
ncbi:MAG: hypothetical protein ACLPHE_10485 [Methanobacterium sp.]